MTQATIMPVLILAAGRGERMRPLTDSVPKPLLKVGGKPLLAYHLERLAEAGLAQVVINTAHLGARIEEWVGDGSSFGLRVRYSREGEAALETGGGIRHALPLLGPGPFMVINGDVFTDFPFAGLRAQGLEEGDLAHLVMVPNPPQHPDGDFGLEGGRLHIGGGTRLTYSGIGLFRAELVAGDRPERFALGPLLAEAVRAGRVSGECYGGRWDDIGTPERLEALDRRLRQSGPQSGEVRMADR